MSSQGQSDPQSQQDAPPKERYKLTKGVAVFVESILAGWCALLFAGGAVFFDTHSPPSYFCFGAAAVGVIAGFCFHYRHILRSKRTIAWRLFSPFIALHLAALAGIALTYSQGRAPTIGPRAELAVIDFEDRLRVDASTRQLIEVIVRPVIRNGGQATAERAACWFIAVIEPSETQPEQLVFGPPAADVSGGAGNIGPGDKRACNSFRISAAQLTAIYNGTARVFGSVRIKYNASPDLPGREAQSNYEFHLNYDPTKAVTHPAGPTPAGQPRLFERSGILPEQTFSN